MMGRLIFHRRMGWGRVILERRDSVQAQFGLSRFCTFQKSTLARVGWPDKRWLVVRS